MIRIPLNKCVSEKVLICCKIFKNNILLYWIYMIYLASPLMKDLDCFSNLNVGESKPRHPPKIFPQQLHDKFI